MLKCHRAKIIYEQQQITKHLSLKFRDHINSTKNVIL